jgi:hypothetical protein
MKDAVKFLYFFVFSFGDQFFSRSLSERKSGLSLRKPNT